MKLSTRYRTKTQIVNLKEIETYSTIYKSFNIFIKKKLIMEA